MGSGQVCDDKHDTMMHVHGKEEEEGEEEKKAPARWSEIERERESCQPLCRGTDVDDVLQSSKRNTPCRLLKSPCGCS